jgi:hypothetical protein
MMSETDNGFEACSDEFRPKSLGLPPGGEPRHQPSDFLRVAQTADLIAELTVPGNPGTTSSKLSDTGNPVSVVRGGLKQGTYVCKELVYAYAMRACLAKLTDPQR